MLFRSYPWLRQVKHAQSCGQSSALRTGIVSARGASIVTLDGDGQNDPAFLPQLVDALNHGAPHVGLIAGQRVGRKASSFKRMQSRIANGVRGAILRDGTRDSGCGLKAFPRDVGLALPYFDGLHRFLPALIRREGRDVGYVDADGYLYLTDRKSHMIISGGVNIYPQEIENLLVTHDKVMDAAVIGAPCPDFGEKVVAVIQPMDMEAAGDALEIGRAHV